MDRRICPNCGGPKWYYAEYCRRCRFKLLPEKERLEWGQKMLERKKELRKMGKPPAPLEVEE